MKIECPTCAHKQTIAPAAVCSGCNTSFAGNLYRKYRKPLISATTALVVGAYGSYKVTDSLRDQARYPLRAEYAIVDACINASSIQLSSHAYKRKQDVCLCAFEATSRHVSYDEMRKGREKFLASMQEAVAACG